MYCGSSALDLYSECQSLADQNHPPLLTFLKSLDGHLKGGLPRKRGIIEFSGAPGSGKTQLMLQLLCMSQIPRQFGGNGCGAIFIDTEASFCPVRTAQLARSIEAHLLLKAQSKGDVQMENLAREWMNMNQVMDNIHVLRVYDAPELLASTLTIEPFIRRMEQKATTNPKILPIGLVIIDSIAFPFRSVGQAGFMKRSAMLNGMVQRLNSLSLAYNLGVIVTNHMTYRGDEGMVPSLGEVWGHHPTLRFELDILPRGINQENQPPSLDSSRQIPLLYQLRLTKCPWISPLTVYFEIRDEGIREHVMKP